MTKLSLLLALGAVSAHRRNHHMKQYLGMAPIEPHMEMPTLWDFMTPLEEPQCPKIEQDENMGPWKFHLTLNKTLWNKFVKGMYHTTSEWPVAEECFGDEAIESVETFADILSKVEKLDFFNISEDQLLIVFKTLTDMLFKDKNDCSLSKPLYDGLHWCTEKPDVCIYGKDTMSRVWENRYSLGAKIMNLADLLWPRDESCMRDAEIIETLGAVTENVTELVSTTSGFDYTWDQSQTVKEEPLTTSFHKLYKASVKAFPEEAIPEIFRTKRGVCPLEMAISYMPTLNATQLPKLNLQGDILIDRVPLNFFIDKRNVPAPPKSFGFGLF